MVLTKFTGLQTMTSSEAEIFNINKGINTIHFGATVYLDEMQSDDGIRIRVYDKRDGLAYWKFDNTLTDSIGTSNGTVTGTTTYVSSAIAGSAISFNGSSYCQMANEPTFDFERTNPFSISLWAKGTSSGIAEVLVSKMNTNATIGYELNFSSMNATIFRLINTSATNAIEVKNSTNLRDGNWHHMVVTYDGSSNASGVIFYIDGLLATTSILTNNLSATILNNVNLVCGAFGDGSSPITGSIDDLRVYARALSGSEAIGIYTNPANLYSIIYDRSYFGVQGLPSVYLPIIQTNNYAVTMQQTTGATLRTIAWSRYEVT